MDRYINHLDYSYISNIAYFEFGIKYFVNLLGENNLKIFCVLGIEL